ncbi:MAG: 1-deoxy-D-xylulose-5-phosphate reductoisomerase [Acidobacteria bacterium]|nr:1-deoxy-D-xylulose-5-phosphate reductoisomerase [Acidobacteriota bacterium]
MKNIGILGSTGTIGRSCLKVIADAPDRYRVASLAAGENVALIAEQVRRFRPSFVSLANERAAEALCKELRRNGSTYLPEISHGPEAIKQAATLDQVDVVLSAVVGIAGLPATYAAVNAGKQVALANKEVLVAAGELVTGLARQRGIELLPVDSEHNGVHQCLRAGRRAEVSRLVLTASGGPFLRTPAEQIAGATVEQALNHPTWRMGNRITIDSATLMNKGFEVIEARWLFGFSPQQIHVKIHPQSTVHSLIEFVDGSVIAQLSVTDMRVPIQYALSYPERIASNEHRFDWEKLKVLEFSEPDTVRFPCLRLAYEALRSGDSYPCALNAADEIAVGAFLERKVPFGAIPCLVEDLLNAVPRRAFQSMEDVQDHDRLCRERAIQLAARYQN